jgi:hypothetical protein
VYLADDEFQISVQAAAAPPHIARLFARYHCSVVESRAGGVVRMPGASTGHLEARHAPIEARTVEAHAKQGDLEQHAVQRGLA